MSDVEEFRNHLMDAEEAYEFMISFAGMGIGQEVPQKHSDQIRGYIEQLSSSLDASFQAAESIADHPGIAGQDQYHAFLADMAREIDEATTVLDLIVAQEKITSAQVDNINGMSVFQSVMMKLFFLDELTKHFGENTT